MLIKKNNFFDYITILIAFYSLYLGYNYCKYNQDFHHWSYILASYIDYENKFKLFKDIFIQYGLGQIFFFSFIDNFYKINIFSIGILTNLIYSTNLLLIYKILSSITSKLVSFILILIIFLIHPFATLPWPDYLSGLFLNFFFYFYLKKNSNYNNIICSIFLFLVIIFRTTYIVNILFSIVFFISYSFFFYKKFFNLRLFFFFFIFLIIFFILLIYNNNLYFYFSQSLNINYYILDRYSLSKEAHDYYNIFISYFKIFLIWISSFLNFFKIQNVIFSIFLFLNLWFIFFSKKKFKKKYFFISLIGVTGFIQSLYNSDIFRIINSTIGIFIIGCLLFEKYNTFYFLKKKIIYFNLLKISLFLFILKLAINFPNNSTTFSYEKYNDKDFTSLNIDFFSNDKKIVHRIAEYYNELDKFLCEKDYKIINFTGDFSLSYLCNNKNSKLFSAMQPFALLNNNTLEYERIFFKKELSKNEIFLSPKEINDPKLTLLIKKNSPHVPKFLYGDIYIYKSSIF